MNRARPIVAIVVAAMCYFAAEGDSANAQTPDGCLQHSAAPAVPSGIATPGGSSVAYQQFPASGSLETAWYVTFGHETAKALFLTSAYFKPGPHRDWIQVLGRAGLSDIFVPYQSGSPRFHDLSQVHFDFDLVTASAKDAGRCGQVVGRNDKVVREVVDKGPLWKNDDEVVRGQKLLLWSTLDAANYNYIVRYEFHDDGTIQFRIAGTAVNYPMSPKEAHTHNALWRIDVNFDGADGDSAYVRRHIEVVGQDDWKNIIEPFNHGKEGAIEFVPTEFTQVQVVDAHPSNSDDVRTSYDIRPLYRGIVRHKERYMRKDFWVTVNHAGEVRYRDLETYVGNNENIRNTDIVVWHVSPLLHVPRTEDGVIKNGIWHGAALAMWAGFDMRPRNLFEGTPFFP